MKNYRFSARVSSNGTIQIPKELALVDQEVDVFILPKSKVNESPTGNAQAFVEKWAGFLTKVETDELKADYLNEKYK